MPATRFAPSPTGALHLGHAYSALMAHDVARAGGGRFLVRIDDLDAGRVRAAFRAGIDADLAWLGLVPDAPPLVQSARGSFYAGALERLKAEALAYPCFCTRSEIAASVAAPHGPDGPLYPGTCRKIDPDASAAGIAAGAAHAWRLDMARAVALAGALYWHDSDAGVVAADPLPFGDVVLARRDDVAAYHLASTLDDAAQGISHVVRGADLFGATHIHRLLQALLDLPTPRYVHHRLIGDAGGRRLAKRDDAASIAGMRAAGVDPAMLTDALRNGALPLGYCWAKP
jgi:glutamyl-Q tRNA(Asp) synthetase